MTNKQLTHTAWISIVSKSLFIENRNISDQSVDFVLVPKGCISNGGRLIVWKVSSIDEMLNDGCTEQFGTTHLNNLIVVELCSVRVCWSR